MFEIGYKKSRHLAGIVLEYNLFCGVNSVPNGFHGSDFFFIEYLAKYFLESVTVNEPPIKHFPVEFIVYPLLNQFDNLICFIIR